VILFPGGTGVSTDPQIVSDSAGNTLRIILHETLHLSSVGNLSDIVEHGNIMDDCGPKLRFKELIQKYDPKGPEKQWEKVPR
jgi:hypothetical protein